MPKKISKNLVSPAKALSQKQHDLKVRRKDLAKYGEPEATPQDVQAYTKPRPTLLNVTTGEWEEVTPDEGRLRGVPLGPPNMDMLNRMFRSGYGVELPVYGSDILRT